MTIEFKTLEYADDFCAGWNLSSCNVSMEEVICQQARNHAFYKRTGKEKLITSGMVNGAEARQQFIEKGKA